MKHVTVRRSVFLFALVGLSACLATLGLPGTGSAGAGDPQSFTVTAVRTSTGQGGASPVCARTRRSCSDIAPRR